MHENPFLLVATEFFLRFATRYTNTHKPDTKLDT
jgi:hypothetical protein